MFHWVFLVQRLQAEANVTRRDARVLFLFRTN